MAHVCIYCDRFSDRKFDGEHIIPSAIGGTKKISVVCNHCNNEFSVIDNILCAGSPLSFVRNREMDRQNPRLWNLDRSSHNLLVEAFFEDNQQKIVNAPQLMLDNGKPKFLADLFDFKDKNDIAVRKFLYYARRAVRGHMQGQKRSRLIFQKEEHNTELFSANRLPPRIFVQKRLDKIDERTTFKIRYLECRNFDKIRLMEFVVGVDTGIFEGSFTNTSNPDFVNRTRSPHDMKKVLAALWKISVNLLSHLCENTQINSRTIPIINLVKGRLQPHSSCLKHNGFIEPYHLADLHSEKDIHTIRVINDGKDLWIFHYCFFGGTICASVGFPGQNNERWKSAIVRAKVKSDHWEVSKSHIHTPVKIITTTDEITKTIPTYEFDDI